MTRRSIAGIGLATALAAGACKPNLDQTVSVVDEPIVLAVRSDPAEGVPPASTKFTALYVDRSGSVTTPPIDWAFCEARKPLAELGPVNTECLQAAGSWFVPIGAGVSVTGMLPMDGCKLFGPAVPPAMMGQPQGRPVDPDLTGGYYEPVRLLTADGTVTVYQTRMACGPGGVASDVGVDFSHRYHVNTNPAVESLSILNADGKPGAALMTSDQGTNTASPGEHLSLRVAWSSCPTADACMDGVCGPDETSTTCPADCAMPKGCTGAERYVVFDIASQTNVDERESIGAAWYTTAGGAVDTDRTGRASADLTATSDNGWRAPSDPGPAHLWVVLRDDRGGVGWAEYVFDVK